MEKTLQAYIEKIEAADQKTMEEAGCYNASLLKIPQSLGRIEELAVKLASITGTVKNDFNKKCIIIMAADNGVTAQNVSAAPQSVTATMTECFTKKVTGVGVFARASSSDLIVYDIGVNADIRDPEVINRKLMYGTHDFTTGPAMPRDIAEKAVLMGIAAVKAAIDAGYRVIGTGEMGIGNTSTTTAVLCALTGAAPAECADSGTGMVDDQALKNKIEAIEKGLTLNKPDRNDPIDVLAKVGGLDIAALAGVYLGCAYYKIPAVIDGYISSCAAYVAYRLNPHTRDYMIESHRTEEKGYRIIENEMGLRPMFDLHMRLGEGSGCPFAFFAIDCADAMMHHMYTFEQGMISAEYTDKIDDLKFETCVQ